MKKIIMDKYLLLLKTFYKKQKGCLIGIFLLMLVNSLCLFSSLHLSAGGQQSVTAEMNRLGFGNLTAWVREYPEELLEELEQNPEISKIVAQPLVFAGYEINGTYSDSDGQLIAYEEDIPYHFISQEGIRLPNREIAQGTVFISPALSSSFDVKPGDTIQFELSRKNGIVSLTVAGYFEDAFMGSSMIDMKSFLISKEDQKHIAEIVTSAKDYDVLGKKGAMLHIFQKDDSRLSEREFQKEILTQTQLPLYVEFSYSYNSILNYMLLLQNIMTGFLIAFSAILLVICFIVISHSLSMVIEQNKRDMAILKTIGFAGKSIRNQYLFLYGSVVFLGLIVSLFPAFLLAKQVAKKMLTSTGMLITIHAQNEMILFILFVQILLFSGFIFSKAKSVLRISPMQTIREAKGSKLVNSAIEKRTLPFCIAVRELLSAKKKYLGACFISFILVAFLSVVGKMGAWLGPDGEGLMNAFSVADHDLGVQPLNESVPMEELERIINWYSPIREKYELAMQSVMLEGQEYTANILDDVKWFHVLQGKVCDEESILITETIANEQDIDIGDEVTVVAEGHSHKYIVSGIYQCANGMGNNIGMSREGYSKVGNVNRYIWCHHYLLEDGTVRDYAMKYLQDHYRGIDVHNNSWSGLSGIVLLMQILIILIYAIAALFIFVSVSLTSSKLLQSECGNMAIYKSLGLTTVKLRLSFALRFLLTVTVGAISGSILAECSANTVIGMIFRSFGIGNFASGFSPMGTLLPPIAVMLFFFGFAWVSSSKIKRMSLVELIGANDV